MNVAGFWVETEMATFELAKRFASLTEMARRLVLAGKSFKAALESLSIRGSYFCNVVEHGVEEARHMAFLFQQVQ